MKAKENLIKDAESAILESLERKEYNHAVSE
jgi:hypothetical protein